MSSDDGVGDGVALVLRGLRKAFATQVVLDGIDLEVQRGTVLGYIGPNGAGKSTTVRILTGLQDEWQGEVRVCGLDPRRDPTALKRRIGYVPENATLFDSLTVAEHLLFVGRLHGLDDDVTRTRAEGFLEAFELLTRLSSRVLTLSKGMRQKLMLTQALLHDPDVLFLDEPLSGLDANAALLIKDLIRALADRGRTVFYCSHVMDVVERVCDRIVILDGGKVIADGTFEQLSAAKGDVSLERIFTEMTHTGDHRRRIERILGVLGADGVE